MVLSSDDKAHRIVKARRSANDFLSFFSQWTGISAKEIANKYRFVSNDKAPPVYVTNFKLQKVDYNHLGTDLFETKSR
jgi:glucan phosphoethanolaminetransferase (alkaline phosphatase superfamily)